MSAVSSVPLTPQNYIGPLPMVSAESDKGPGEDVFMALKSRIFLPSVGSGKVAS